MEKFKKKAITTGVAGLLTFFGWNTAQDVYNGRLDDYYEVSDDDRRAECIKNAEGLDDTTNILAIGGLAVTGLLLSRTYQEAEVHIKQEA